jgi:LmbE family N-acetylglucosaminyl deacetylase
VRVPGSDREQQGIGPALSGHSGGPDTPANCPLALTADDRVLVFAPHPDDESLATGGLLQRARSLGAAVRVVFLTDGDNNPWAQRAVERRFWLGARDRVRFAVRRRKEALDALAVLGVNEPSAVFLALPDQGLTGLLMHSSERVIPLLVRELREWRPTLLVGPSLAEIHADHSATAVMIRLALAALPRDLTPPLHLRYVIHNRHVRQGLAFDRSLSLSEIELARKGAAIRSHRTQLISRRAFLLAFAQAVESYLTAEPDALATQHPIYAVRRDCHSIHFDLASHNHIHAFGRRTVCFAGNRPQGGDLRYVTDLPVARRNPTVLDLTVPREAGRASLAGSVRHGTLTLPAELLPSDCTFFAKVEHNFGFFDEAGWRTVEPTGSASDPAERR